MFTLVRHTVALACAPETCGGKRTLLDTQDTLLVARPLSSSLRIVTRLLGLCIVHSAGVHLQEAGPSLAWQQNRPSIPDQCRLTRFPWSDISADSQARGARNEHMSFLHTVALFLLQGWSGSAFRPTTDSSPRLCPQGNTTGITSVASEHVDGRRNML